MPHTLGAPTYRRAAASVFAAGIAAFIAMYSVQGILPSITHEMRVPADVADLTIACTTIAMAIVIIPLSTFSEQWGRRRVIVGSAIATGIVGMLLPLADNIETLLVGRILLGIAISGIPATVIAYIAEEFDSEAATIATGLYVSGTGCGGLMGRFFPAMASGWWNLHIALTVAGALGLVAVIATVWLLPPSQHFVSERVDLPYAKMALKSHLRNPNLLALFAIGFLIMGGYVGFYDMLAYHMQSPPIGLTRQQYSWMFFINVVGMIAPSRAGRLANRWGKPIVFFCSLIMVVVGVALTAIPSVLVIIVGCLLLTAGVFAVHSVASAWVGATAKRAKAQASAMYMCAFYGGNAVISSIAGAFYQHAGWEATVGFVTACVMCAAILGLALRVMGRRDGQTQKTNNLQSQRLSSSL